MTLEEKYDQLKEFVSSISNGKVNYLGREIDLNRYKSLYFDSSESKDILESLKDAAWKKLAEVSD